MFVMFIGNFNSTKAELYRCFRESMAHKGNIYYLVLDEEFARDFSETSTPTFLLHLFYRSSLWSALVAKRLGKKVPDFQPL